MARKIERVGIVFVHGIGEQRRFEHLEGHLRPLIAALTRRNAAHATRVTVEIVSGSSAALHAEQDTWAANPEPAVRAVVREGETEKHLFFHEVWWADVNEPYSFAKQLRFWWWGLSLWAAPGKYESDLSGSGAMVMPNFQRWRWRDELAMRARLFFVSNVFAVAAFSLGAVVFLAKRLVGFNAPSPVRVFVNYISAVMLYSQRRRFDGGFLDALNEPPRVSIRRRMIRALADVGSADYDRWYVLAHSLGSVVAFNGLMENAHALPNYLDEARWKKLTRMRRGARLAGPARPGVDYLDNKANKAEMMPARPIWLGDDAVIYRDRLFADFKGLLTYGSPLDKFAGIWPARVPINRHETALENAEWINVYDPTDPVAARLDAFGSQDSRLGSIYPVNYGYRASPLLLYSHLKYLDGADGKSKLADVTAEWVLSGGKFTPPLDTPGSPWYKPPALADFSRGALALATWLAVYVVLLWLGVWNLLALPLWDKLVDSLKGFASLFETFVKSSWEAGTFVNVSRPIGQAAATLFSRLLDCIDFAFAAALGVIGQLFRYVLPARAEGMLDTAMFKLGVAVFLFTLAVGLISRLFRRRDHDDVRRVLHKNAAKTPAKSAS